MSCAVEKIEGKTSWSSIHWSCTAVACRLSSTNSNNFSSVWWWIQERLGLNVQDISWRVQSTYYPSFIQVSTAKRHRARNCTVSHFPEEEEEEEESEGFSLSFPASSSSEQLGLKWGPPSLAWPPTSRRDPWIHNGFVQMNKWNKVLNDTTPLWGAKWHDRLSKATLTKRHKGNLCPSQVQRRFWVHCVFLRMRMKRKAWY